MSASSCIKCSERVSMYEKYCTNCVETLHLRQDENWHRGWHETVNVDAEIQLDTIEVESTEKVEHVAPIHAVIERGSRRTLKFSPPTVVSGRDGRVPCAGGCNTLVLMSIGECRKCRRTRLKNGKRVIAKITKQQKNIIDAG